MPYDSKAKQNAWRQRHPEVSARWRAAHPEQKHQRQRDLDARRRYSFESYAALREARNRPCEICGKQARKMCADHAGRADQFFGTHRGILCQQCNTRLGWFERHRVVIEGYVLRGVACAS